MGMTDLDRKIADSWYKGDHAHLKTYKKKKKYVPIEAPVNYKEPMPLRSTPTWMLKSKFRVEVEYETNRKNKRK
jgi:hypothetical protein